MLKLHELFVNFGKNNKNLTYKYLFHLFEINKINVLTAIYERKSNGHKLLHIVFPIIDLFTVNERSRKFTVFSEYCGYTVCSRALFSGHILFILCLYCVCIVPALCLCCTYIVSIMYQNNRQLSHTKRPTKRYQKASKRPGDSKLR